MDDRLIKARDGLHLCFPTETTPYLPTTNAIDPESSNTLHSTHLSTSFDLLGAAAMEVRYKCLLNSHLKLLNKFRQVK